MRADAFGRVRHVVLRCWVRGEAALRAHRPHLLVAVAALLSMIALGLPAASGQGRTVKSAPAAAKGTPAKVRRDLGVAARTRRVGRELVGLRTRTSKTFVSPRGGRIARLYATPVHFQGRRGGWQTIDSRLRRAGARWINRANRYSVALPADIGRGAVRVRRGPRWVQFSLRGARGRAVVRGSEALYRDALPGVTVSYRAQAASVKETLTLSGPRAQRRFVFDVAVARGLRPRLLRGKGLVVRDRRGRTRLAIAAPWMVDARGRKSTRVALALANVRGRWRLTMTPSRRWLERRGRAWPVQVDPYVYTEPDQDCQLDESTPATSLCGSDALAVGTSDHGGTAAAHRHATVLRFPGLSAIPRDVEVQWAAVKLWVKTLQAPSWVKMPAQPLTGPWSGQATWNHADGVERWAEPGGEADERPGEGSEDGGAWLGPTTTYGFWKVNKMVRDWVSGRRPNHGMLITAPSTHYAEFHPTEVSGNTDPNSAQGNEPRLEVEYAERIGERRGWRFERLQLSDRISLAVNVASGNLMVRQTDFSMPGGLGPAITVSRTYNSLNRRGTRIGQSWTLDTGHDVVLENWGSTKIYQGPSGVRVAFEHNGNGYTAPAGIDATLTDEADGERMLTDNQSQTKQRFSSSGRLLWIEDRNGRRLTFDYAASGATRITAIKNDAGETKATFAYDASERLDTFTDAAGRIYDYTQDAYGKLTSYADPQNGTANPTLYAYDNHCSKISKITTPGGRIALIGYFPAGHAYECRVKSVTRVTNTTTMTGPTHEFDYDIERDGSGKTEVTDPNGSATADANDRIWRYTFDDQGRVTKTRDPLGRETSRKLTSNSNVESYTAASNSGTTPNTSFTYDADENATGSDTPTGQGSITEFADFGAADSNPSDPAPSGYQGVPSGVQGSKWLPGRATNPQGGRTAFSWQDSGATDTNGNLYGVQATDNAGNVVSTTTLNWGSNATDGKKGQLNSITDGRNNTTSYGYDAKGNVSTITPPAPLGQTTLEYTQTINRLARVKDANGNWRVLSYDNLDRVTRIDFTGANTTLDSGEPYVAYTYDRDGNQTAEETREQGTNTIRTRSMTYDTLNRVTYESLPGGQSNTMAYDNVGNLRSLTDAGGKVEYTYNAANEIRAVYEPGTTRPTKFEHSKEGQRTKTTYPNDVVMAVGYDAAFRLSEIHAHKSGTTLQKFRYAYQQPGTNGRQTPLRQQMIDDKLGRTTDYVYDALDRLDTATTTSTGTTTVLAKYDYDVDPSGNIIKKTLSGSQLAAGTTTYAYNAANQLCWRSSTGATPPADACTTAMQSTFDNTATKPRASPAARRPTTCSTRPPAWPAAR